MMTRIFFYAFIAALFLCPPLMAQEQKGSGFNIVQLDKESLDQKIDVDFTGGTIPQLLALIEKTNGVKANVIVSKEAARLTFPSFSLRSATVYETVSGLKELGMVDGYYLRAARNDNVMTLLAEDRGAQAAQKHHKKSTKIYSLSDVLADGDFGIDDIVTSIETAWEMRPEENTAALKYHDETKLLIAVGSGDELVMVEEVLNELMIAQNTARTREERKTSKKSQADLIGKINYLAQCIEDLKADNAKIKNEVTELIKKTK